MNFLAHHHIRHSVHDPAFTLGKILPDLLRTFQPDWRVSKGELLQYFPPENLLVSGMVTHIRTDGIFHNSAYFKSVVHQVSEMVRQMEWPNQFRHGWFFSHVLAEMLLDRVLLRNKKWLADDFYWQLSQVELATLEPLFKYKDWTTAMNGFWTFLQRFIQSRYLYTYLQDDHLLYALSRVGARVGLSLFGEPYRTTLVHMLPQMEQVVSQGHSAIFETIENQLTS